MLLRSVTVVDPLSPHHGETVDIQIEEGLISTIKPTAPGDELRYCAPGFLDIGAYLGDPGHEEREDVASLIAAARAGGYTGVAVLPNTEPVRQSVADVAYLTQNNGTTSVDLLPLAALSVDTAGKDLTGMLELRAAGALAFTDGPEHSLSGSLLKRGLEYARACHGIVVATPYDGRLAPEGQLHEGELSVRLGMRGIPALCETIPLRRDLELLAYTDGRLIVHLISTAAGLDHLVGAAGKERPKDSSLGSTVGIHHLCFTVEELSGFDTNFKMLPPLRTESDRQALMAGVLDGRIDAIVSHHQARHGEEKELEFPYAAFGARGLETAFRQALSLIEDDDQLATVVSAFSHGPRRLLDLPRQSVLTGDPAQLTLFTTEGSSTITPADLHGKTVNSPLLNRKLPGRILATVNNNRLWTSAS